ncbi:predicted protein [Coccidioides posadasii str. Silveira]|uniref:Predicted protein n=1 Tax=Coccidioides posadasii (strain RMSCC 757 / Silveira) TaxID=443226 RepID=E9DBJ1_COCPS|nr:predicted protein [Coccidioides posadasii str. Silveira]
MAREVLPKSDWCIAAKLENGAGTDLEMRFQRYLEAQLTGVELFRWPTFYLGPRKDAEGIVGALVSELSLLDATAGTLHVPFAHRTIAS